LPFGKDKDKDFSSVERDVEFLHGEAVVDFEGEMIEENSFVTLE
jgi:hypothetical protein